MRRKSKSEARQTLPLRCPRWFRSRWRRDSLSTRRSREEGPVNRMAEKKAQKKPATTAAAAKPIGSAARDVGDDGPVPEKTCTDAKCPLHRRLSVRGQTLECVLVSTRLPNTVV